MTNVEELLYQIALEAAHEAARNDSIPFENTIDYVDAACFIGRRLGNTEIEVVNDCIDFTIAVLERGGSDG
jgi:hypothetical protein